MNYEVSNLAEFVELLFCFRRHRVSNRIAEPLTCILKRNANKVTGLECSAIRSR